MTKGFLSLSCVLSSDCIDLCYCGLPSISALLLDQESQPVTLNTTRGVAQVTAHSAIRHVVSDVFTFLSCKPGVVFSLVGV